DVMELAAVGDGQGPPGSHRHASKAAMVPSGAAPRTFIRVGYAKCDILFPFRPRQRAAAPWRLAMESCRSVVFSRLAPALLAPVAVLALLGAAPSGESAVPSKPSPAAASAVSPYEQEIAAWHRERIEGLKRPEGWLSLVGLFWLKEGENRMGSGADNTVIFPEGSAPAFAGTLERHGQQVVAHAPRGVPLTPDGKPVTDLDLQSPPGKVTELALGSLRFFVIYRGDKVGVRIKDLKSPTLAAFHDVDTYPVRTAWRVDARFEP